MPAKPTILVVDDERDLVDLYAAWVSGDYDVRTAYGGREALEELEDGQVDIVLLDRRMPDLSGDEVLARMREDGHDAWVVMVTAVDPGLDIVDMDIDDYLVKPVSRQDLVDRIESLRSEAGEDEERRELVSLTRKRATLQQSLSPTDLQTSEEYERLEEEIEELDADLEDSPF